MAAPYFTAAGVRTLCIGVEVGESWGNAWLGFISDSNYVERT